jgi:hypothetical protein
MRDRLSFPVCRCFLSKNPPCFLIEKSFSLVKIFKHLKQHSLHRHNMCWQIVTPLDSTPASDAA